MRRKMEKNYNTYAKADTDGQCNVAKQAASAAAAASRKADVLGGGGGDGEEEEASVTEEQLELLHEFTPRVRNAWFAIFCLNYFFLSACYSLIGPTLQALLFFMSTNQTDFGRALSTRSITMGIFTVLANFMFKCFNRHHIFIIALICIAFLNASIPFLQNVWQFGCVEAAIGICSAITDNVVVMNLFQLFPIRSQMQTQICYFFYAFGTAVGPFIVGFFLPGKLAPLPKNVTDMVSLNSSSFSLLSTNTVTSKMAAYTAVVGAGDNNPYANVYISYLICSVLLLLSGSAIIIFQQFKPFVPRERKLEAKNAIVSANINTDMPSGSSSQEVAPTEIAVKFPASYFYTVIAISTLQTASIGCMEQISGTFLSTYLTHGPAKMGEDDASYALSVQMTSFTAARFLSIVASYFIPPRRLQPFHIASVGIGFYFLSQVNESNSDYIWLVNIAIGAGFSSMYPFSISYLEKRINVTNSVVCFIGVSGTLIFALALIALSNIIESNYFYFIYFLAACYLSVMLLFGLFLITDVWKRRIRRDAADGQTQLLISS